ncbi:GntR family transcriptional regulator [Szabonella alba]|uniref:GntR family transcriptional regulator n=1 Tax=Szabonella alba TaxID=2804194 RepID=A0A8K0Y000_9RHOB|nr:GntR family transcriptional regulator [Szabonella alba]MBL4916578.1 GntR family transcriptional regulator [Szabonella alba]
MFERQSLAEQVEAELRREITEGRLSPGARVSIADYQTAWNISATPFRDALRSLETQGLVTIEARRGVFVAPMNQQTLREIFDLRIALEPMAVELATPRIPAPLLADLVAGYETTAARLAQGQPVDLQTDDQAVHDLAREYCGNVRLGRLIAEQTGLFIWAQNTIVSELPRSHALALPEHLAIAQAMAARDAGRAAAAMRRHLENTRDRIIALRAG